MVKEAVRKLEREEEKRLEKRINAHGGERGTWTELDDQTLRDLLDPAAKLSYKDVEKLLGRTAGACRIRVYHLNGEGKWPWPLRKNRRG